MRTSYTLNAVIFYATQVRVEQTFDREERRLRLRCGVVGVGIGAGSNQQGSV